MREEGGRGVGVAGLGDGFGSTAIVRMEKGDMLKYIAIRFMCENRYRVLCRRGIAWLVSKNPHQKKTVHSVWFLDLSYLKNHAAISILIFTFPSADLPDIKHSR
jgi:hypothetical protein